MANIRIPEDVQNGFKSIINLTPSERSQILEIIKILNIGFSPRNLSDEISKCFTIGIGRATEMTSTIFSLIGNQSSESEKFIQDISEALIYQEIVEGIPDDFNAFLTELIGIISSDKYNLTKKAIHLTYERSNLLSNSKVIADLRPIFSDEDDTEVKAHSLLLYLVIKFRKSNNDSLDTLIFAIDTDDLESLKDQINRAEQKIKSLKEKHEGLNLMII